MILQISVQTNVNLLQKFKKLPRTSGVTKNPKLKTKNY